MTKVRIERKSSIEAEPLTLSFAELQLAREAAMYILHNKPLEEAIKIFTEGVEPVPRIRDNPHFFNGDGYNYGSEEEEGDEEEEEEMVMKMEFCLWRDQRLMYLDPYLERDIATAPF